MCLLVPNLLPYCFKKISKTCLKCPPGAGQLSWEEKLRNLCDPVSLPSSRSASEPGTTGRNHTRCRHHEVCPRVGGPAPIPSAKKDTRAEQSSWLGSATPTGCHFHLEGLPLSSTGPKMARLLLMVVQFHRRPRNWCWHSSMLILMPSATLGMIST